ncbi:MAG: thiamine pyrophosphate-dependent enzyme [Elusimicrobiota bacterium]
MNKTDRFTAFMAESIQAAVKRAGVPAASVAVVCDIESPQRDVTPMLAFDSFGVAHGRAIPFAIGMKLANPKLKVLVYTEDSNLGAMGGSHLANVARRNVDLTVLCAETTAPAAARRKAWVPPQTMKDVCVAEPFVEAPISLTRLADACGASYVARWTERDAECVTETLAEAFVKPGFSYVEVIESPAGRSEAVGKLVDRQAPTCLGMMNRHLSKNLGSRYVWWGEKP